MDSASSEEAEKPGIDEVDDSLVWTSLNQLKFGIMSEVAFTFPSSEFSFQDIQTAAIFLDYILS